jgi:hypothetical protein
MIVVIFFDKMMKLNESFFIWHADRALLRGLGQAVGIDLGTVC